MAAEFAIVAVQYADGYWPDLRNANHDNADRGLDGTPHGASGVNDFNRAGVVADDTVDRSARWAVAGRRHLAAEADELRHHLDAGQRRAERPVSAAPCVGCV